MLAVHSTLCDGLIATAPEACNIDAAQNAKNTKRDDFLKFHNDMRENIAKGTAFESFGKLPAAKNMYQLLYSCRLEYDLQKELDKCTGKITDFKGRGQNLAILYDSAAPVNPEQKFKDALYLWGNTARIYGKENSENIYDARMYPFANMAYGKTLRVGCAYKQCNNEAHISCLYNLVGAYVNNSIYEKGSACTKNVDCTTYAGSTCGGVNTMCAGNDGMTDEARNKVLSEHNNKRSLLARGLIRNGKNVNKRNLPASSYMPKMIYDCATEASAIEYANTCTLVKSAADTRSGYGENVYVYSKPNADPAAVLKEAVEKWWNQIFEDAINWRVTYIPSLMNKPIDQNGFTQMAWAKSVKLGCGIQTCNAQSFIVCRYSPTGNVLNEQIYTPGRVCAGCSAACNASEGLCNLV
ncbi:hypothetical protein RB195_012430 [Necator americanus]|uniref:SCP domain-containing protein n=1 Tax=Necator americanus TaxID=51031 RepID=A0ABR1D7X2_NECAM